MLLVYMCFICIWTLGNLPEVDISEQNKAITNTITSIVDNRVFFLSFFPKNQAP